MHPNKPSLMPCRMMSLTMWKGYLLDTTKSLAKALKTGSDSEKKVKALGLANRHLQNDLAVALSKLKDATKQKNKKESNLTIS
jgi:hypothetical protein